MCPGLNWLLKFGKVTGIMICREFKLPPNKYEEFKLSPRKYEEYEGLWFYNGDCGLVVDV